MEKKGGSQLTETLKFWREVCIAAAQVTFGVVAAIWFISPFDGKKALVLSLNGIATILFVIAGSNFARRLT